MKVRWTRLGKCCKIVECNLLNIVFVYISVISMKATAKGLKHVFYMICKRLFKCVIRILVITDLLSLSTFFIKTELIFFDRIFTRDTPCPLFLLRKVLWWHKHQVYHNWTKKMYDLKMQDLMHRTKGFGYHRITSVTHDSSNCVLIVF